MCGVNKYDMQTNQIISQSITSLFQDNNRQSRMLIAELAQHNAEHISSFITRMK